MAILFSILLVTASFIAFAAISWLLVRSTFPKIENDDWEERYLQMKKETERLTRVRKSTYSFRDDKVLG